MNFLSVLQHSSSNRGFLVLQATLPSFAYEDPYLNSAIESSAHTAVATPGLA
jgi:hypothetical protein